MAQPPSQRYKDRSAVDEFAPERPTVQPRHLDLEAAVLWLADRWRSAGPARGWYVGVPAGLFVVGVGWLAWWAMQPAAPAPPNAEQAVASAPVEQSPIVPPTFENALPSRDPASAAPVDSSVRPVEKPPSTDAPPARRAAREKSSPTPLSRDASQVSPPTPRPAQVTPKPTVDPPAREEVPPPPPAVASAAETAPPPVTTTKSAVGITTWDFSTRPVEDPESVAIQDLLGRYRTAYASLDAARVQQVWPSVNQRSLERAFRQLEGQDIAFFSCTIDVEGAQAGASCVGTTNFIPKVGSRSPQSGPSQWNFKLSKRSAGPWLIDDVEAR